ncbi:MAG: hypothetical protein PUP91_22385 [Rhizonema sp. PD37]|nr:hypothetical protein [Rhizonema sp. PD37]
MRKAITGVVLTAATVLSISGASSIAGSTDRFLNWTANDSPTEASIVGGPWTLAQSGASNALPSAGYCVNNVRQNNPGTELMQPYYFPLTTGVGNNLQGYFDYRPRNITEAIVAATSNDAGKTWSFQRMVLDLSDKCPASDSDTNNDDNGQGHPFVMRVQGRNYLYTLDRSADNIDQSGLVVHQLNPEPELLLQGVAEFLDVPQRTTGLLNPDGIIGEIPKAKERLVMYLQKQKSADNTGDTALPESQQCGVNPTGRAANHDIVTPRLATTKDGVNFKDLGAVSGLNDSTTVSLTQTRYVGPRGTIIELPNHRYGLFFSGGNCLDADSDAFHYIGYAESQDLRHWTIVNGINNPIASVAPITVNVNDTPTTIPSNTPVVGETQSWFAGRVYSPSVTLLNKNDVTLVFAGYRTAQPSNDLSNYRTIGRVSLKGEYPSFRVRR